MCTSRERFLQQLERCVQHQPEHIEPGPTITAPAEEWVAMGEFLTPELVGNGEEVVTDTSSTWGLRPPNESSPDPLPHPLNHGFEYGDWA